MNCTSASFLLRALAAAANMLLTSVSKPPKTEATTMLRASLDGVQQRTRRNMLDNSLWEERPTLITRDITEICDIRNMLTERLNVRKQLVVT